MAILFEPLSVINYSSAGAGHVVFNHGGRGFDIAADDSIGWSRMSFGNSGIGEVYGYGELVPPIPATGSSAVYFGHSGVPYSREFSDGYGPTVAFAHRGADIAAGSSAGRGTVVFSHGGVPVYDEAAYAYLAAPPSMLTAYSGFDYAIVRDEAVLSDPQAPLPIVVMRELLRLVATRRARFRGRMSAADAVAVADDALWIVFGLVEDLVLFDATGAGQGTAIGRALERLLLSGVASNVVEARAALLDALVLRELAQALHLGAAADTVLTSAVIDSLYSALAQALDRVLLSADAGGLYSLTVLVEDRVVLGEALAHEAQLVAVIRDAVGFAMSLSFDSGEYIAWVMNTQSKGLSRYTNYPFNSFGRIGGRYVGCAADGLHWLDGDTDNGEQINAVIRTSMDALGTRRAKRLPEAFIGYSSSGTLILKVILTGEQSGQREAAYYRLPVRPAESKRENRVKIGRGLKAVDFAFQLENADGADFELDSIEFRPINLDRRTRG